jgi:hypothetical protein
MKKCLFISIILLSFGISNAQDNYVITLKSDTLRGDIKLLSYSNLDRVQVVNNGKKENFSALQIYLIYKEGETYKAVKYENSIRLMKILQQGFLTLYAYQPPNVYRYDGRFLVKQDGTSMDLPNINFKRVLSGYLDECPPVNQKIKSGEYTKKDIEQIVKEYNYCMTEEKPLSIDVAPAGETVNKKSDSVTKFIDKINTLEFSNKSDALDLLKDIKSKVDKGENIPNYQIETLKAMLSEQEGLKPEVEQLISILKNEGQ